VPDPGGFAEAVVAQAPRYWNQGAKQAGTAIRGITGDRRVPPGRISSCSPFAGATVAGGGLALAQADSTCDVIARHTCPLDFDGCSTTPDELKANGELAEAFPPTDGGPGKPRDGNHEEPPVTPMTGGSWRGIRDFGLVPAPGRGKMALQQGALRNRDEAYPQHVAIADRPAATA